MPRMTNTYMLAGDDDPQARGGGQQPSHQWRYAAELFEVVKDQEQLAGGHLVKESVLRVAFRRGACPDGLTDGDGHDRTLCECLEWHKDDAVTELAHGLAAKSQGQPSLADPTGAGKGDQEDIIAEQEALQRVQLLHAPDHWSAGEMFLPLHPKPLNTCSSAIVAPGLMSGLVSLNCA